MFRECFLTKRQMFTFYISLSSAHRLTLGCGYLLACLSPNLDERVIHLSEHVRSFRESSDKVGQPATQLGGKFDCLLVYGEFLRGGIVEHVSR